MVKPKEKFCFYLVNYTFARRVDPDQTASIGAACYGPTLFLKEWKGAYVV